MQNLFVCFMQNPLVCFMQNPFICFMQNPFICFMQNPLICFMQNQLICFMQNLLICFVQKPLILLRIEIDDLLQCILANGAELWSLVDAHAAILNATVYALRTVSGTLEDTHLGLCHLLVL